MCGSPQRQMGYCFRSRVRGYLPGRPTFPLCSPDLRKTVCSSAPIVLKDWSVRLLLLSNVQAQIQLHRQQLRFSSFVYIKNNWPSNYLHKNEKTWSAYWHLY